VIVVHCSLHALRCIKTSLTSTHAQFYNLRTPSIT